MFNRSDISRDGFQLAGKQSRRGYDWWWNSFTGRDSETGEEKPFFIEFFTVNPALAGDEPSFGRKGETPSYLMVKVGAWGEDASQLHRFFPWKDVDVPFTVPYHVTAGDCHIEETRTWGRVDVSAEDAAEHPEWMCSPGSMEWDLEIDKKVAFNVGYGAGRLFRRMQLFEMFWHAEGMKTLYSGKVIWNGRRYDVVPETSYGYSDKNWGSDFTSPWVWLSSCDLVSTVTGKRLEDSVFDIGGGAPKVGPIRLKRKLLSAYWHEGKCHEFNFSKFWTFVRTSFSSKETEDEIIWHVEQRNLSERMVTDIRCEKKDMLLINYESPDGMKRHERLWNGGNGKGTVKLWKRGKLIDEVICSHVGCEYGEYGK